MITMTNFDSYFNSIQNQQKVGDLDNAPAKITSIQDYKSPKSGKNSLKLTINVNGSDIAAYLGYGSEKSAEISLARLTRLSVAAIGIEETKKIYEASANDEDVDTVPDLIVEFGTKLNKKIKKNPVDVLVTRHKEGDFWDTKWFIQSEETAETAEAPKTEETDEFLKDI